MKKPCILQYLYLLLTLYWCAGSPEKFWADLPDGTCLCADGNGINIRRAGDIGADVLGRMYSGNCFKYFGQRTLVGEYCWHQFLYDAQTQLAGWTVGRFLKVASTPAEVTTCQGIGATVPPSPPPLSATTELQGYSPCRVQSDTSISPTRPLQIAAQAQFTTTLPVEASQSVLPHTENTTGSLKEEGITPTPESEDGGNTNRPTTSTYIQDTSNTENITFLFSEISIPMSNVTEQPEITTWVTEVTKKPGVSTIISNAPVKSEDTTLISTVTKKTEVPSLISKLTEHSVVSTLISKVTDQSEVTTLTSEVTKQSEATTLASKVTKQAEVTTLTFKVTEKVDVTTHIFKVTEEPDVSKPTPKRRPHPDVTTSMSKVTDQHHEPDYTFMIIVLVLLGGALLVALICFAYKYQKRKRRRLSFRHMQVLYHPTNKQEADEVFKL